VSSGAEILQESDVWQDRPTGQEALIVEGREIPEQAECPLGRGGQAHSGDSARIALRIDSTAGRSAGLWLT
jgi:hypothetical protein